jgi:hypothetical protein
LGTNKKRPTTFVNLPKKLGDANLDSVAPHIFASSILPQSAPSILSRLIFWRTLIHASFLLAVPARLLFSLLPLSKSKAGSFDLGF